MYFILEKVFSKMWPDTLDWLRVSNPSWLLENSINSTFIYLPQIVKDLELSHVDIVEEIVDTWF